MTILIKNTDWFWVKTEDWRLGLLLSTLTVWYKCCENVVVFLAFRYVALALGVVALALKVVALALGAVALLTSLPLSLFCPLPPKPHHEVLKIHENNNNLISALNVREFPKFSCPWGNRGTGTQWWHHILDRKWKYGRFVHVQWKICNIILYEQLNHCGLGYGVYTTFHRTYF